MTRTNCSFLLLLIVSLSACGQSKPPSELPVGERVATVNGKPIGKSAFELYVSNIERQQGMKLDTAQRGQLLDQFIGLHLAADAGEKSGLGKDQKVADQIDYWRTSVLADAALQKYLADNPVKEEELKPEYDAQVAKLPTEYHTRHILVANKDSAEALIKQIQRGANFAKLAVSKSQDSSNVSGGDMGWLTTDTMLAPYAAAVTALKVGEFTPTPVQTDFGWHVIRLEESRPQQPPAFEEVKNAVEVQVKRKRVQGYLEKLRKDAKVDLVEPPPATKS